MGSPKTVDPELNPNPTLPPAGWYPDPSGAPSSRWWSGADWTEYLQSSEQGAQIVPNAPPTLATPSADEGGALVLPAVELVGASDAKTGRSISGQGPLTGQLRLPGGTQPHYYRQETGAIAINPEPAYEAMAGAGYANNTYTRLLPSLPVYTAAVWWYALTPLWLTAVSVAFIVIVPQINTSVGVPGLLLNIIVALITIGLVRSDRNTLVAGGHNTAASAWWWLLGPVAYLIARGVHVRRATGKGFAPLVAYLVSNVIVVAALVAVSLAIRMYVPNFPFGPTP